MFKLHKQRSEFTSDSRILISNGFVKISWITEGVYLVKTSIKGIVDLKGSLLIKNSDIKESITLTTYGYKKNTKILLFKKLNIVKENTFASELNPKDVRLKDKRIFFKLPEIIAFSPTLQFKENKPFININIEEIQAELNNII